MVRLCWKRMLLSARLDKFAIVSADHVQQWEPLLISDAPAGGVRTARTFEVAAVMSMTAQLLYRDRSGRSFAPVEIITSLWKKAYV